MRLVWVEGMSFGCGVAGDWQDLMRIFVAMDGFVGEGRIVWMV